MTLHTIYHHTKSMSALSQLLVIRFGPNFKVKLSESIFNRCQLSRWHLFRQHLSCGHLSISAISQLLLAWFGSNFKQRVLGTYTTDYNCNLDICLGNICPGDICPYQQYKYIQAEHFRLQSCLFQSKTLCRDSTKTYFFFYMVSIKNVNKLGLIFAKLSTAWAVCLLAS